MKNALIVFAKPPIAGQAKTRLIPALGETGAADMHAKLLWHTLENVCSKGKDSDTWDTHLWCANELSNEFFAACENSFELVLHEQKGLDLGERMTHAIDEMLKSYQRVCIIGSDCPVMDDRKIMNIFSCLETENDVVITPAEDGGYVQLAVKQKLQPEIFSDIDWGTADVFNQTLNKIKARGLNAIIQPVLWDVDEPEDLERISF